MIGAEALHEILDFDFEAGKMYWKWRPNERSQWNGRYAGKEAFTAKVGPYRQGAIFGKLYQAHRVIFAAAHGEWPPLIDHINQNGLDNRISNLRAADKALNAYNAKVRADSQSGITGVSWFRRRAKWRAYLTKNGAQVHIGYFTTLSEASSARAKALAAHIEPRG